MHIANGKSRERALAGREAFELDRREGHHPAAQIAVGAALAGGAIIAAMIMGRRHEQVLDDEMYAVEFAEMHEPVAHQPKPLTSLLVLDDILRLLVVADEGIDVSKKLPAIQPNRLLKIKFLQ